MALALPAVAIALLGLLIAFAFFPMVRAPLYAVVNAVPLIGGVLAAAMDSAIWWAYSQSINVAAGAIRGAGEIFSVPTMMQHWLTDNVGAAAASAAMAAWRISHITIPLIVSQLTSLAYWARDAAIQFAAQVEHDVVGLIWDRFNASIQFAAQVEHDVAGLAWDLYYQATAFAAQVEHDVVGLVWNRYQAVEADLGAEAAAITGLVAQVDTNLQGLIWDRWRAAEADAGAALGATEAELGRAIDGARAEARAEAGAAQAAGIAAAGVVAAELSRLMERDCIKFCNPVGGLGSILQDLEDIGLEALLLGLIAEAVSDPQAVLADVSSVVAPIVEDIGQGVTELAGIGSRAA